MTKAIALCLAFLLCLSCRQTNEDVIGIYRMEPLETTPRGRTDPGWDVMALGIMSQTSLEIKANGTFRYEIHIEMYPKETPTATVGKWQPSGSRLMFIPDQNLGGQLSIEQFELDVTKRGVELLPVEPTRPGRGYRYYRSDTKTRAFIIW